VRPSSSSAMSSTWRMYAYSANMADRLGSGRSRSP
jgi:hypothetical protein